MAHYAQIQPLSEVMEINSCSITHLKSLLQKKKQKIE